MQGLQQLGGCNQLCQMCQDGSQTRMMCITGELGADLADSALDAAVLASASSARRLFRMAFSSCMHGTTDSEQLTLICLASLPGCLTTRA